MIGLWWRILCWARGRTYVVGVDPSTEAGEGTYITAYRDRRGNIHVIGEETR